VPAAGDTTVRRARTQRDVILFRRLETDPGVSCVSRLAAIAAPSARALWRALAVAAAVSAAAAEIVPSDDFRGALEDLADPDYEVRFRAAVWASTAQEEGLDSRLAALAQDPLIRDSAHALAAVEFVRWKRSGRRMPDGPARPAAQPNFLLISIDTLRPDRLGCYGHARPTSPNIDALAAAGTRFEKAYSTTSWTLPGHMSLFTSLYPSFHKLDHNSRLGTVRLDDGERTLTELLKGAGYRTASFVTHPFLSADWGFGRGFDLYVRDVCRAEENTGRALQWIEWHRYHERKGLEPSGFFLFVHYIDPHETYSAPPPFLDRYTGDYRGPLKPTDHLVTMFGSKPFPSEADFRYALDLYDGEIAYVDSQIGRLRDALAEAGWLDSTVIALTSDHGEEFKDHGGMGHKTTLYEEQLRVPLIIACPPRVAAGRTIADRVSLLDIMPTLLALAGERPPGAAQGLDLGPLLAPGPPAAGADERRGRLASRPLFGELGPLGFRWEKNYCVRSISQDGRKLILTYPSRGDITRGLFHLEADASERRNLHGAKGLDAEHRRLERRLSDFIKAGAAHNAGFRSRNKIEIDEAIQQKLRSLGYID
jgi:arylsulfatase A-like enzyme